MTGALAAIALAGLAAAPGPAAPVGGAGVELLRDFTIAVPPGAKTAVRLRVAPVSDEVLDRLGPSAPLFAVGPQGAIWLGVDPGVLLNATQGYRFRPAVPISDVAALGGGQAVATTHPHRYLAPDPGPGGAAGAVAFQPLADLPVAEARLAAGADGSLYVFGPARGGDGHAVYRLAPEPAGAPGARALRAFRRVFAGPERIAAVAGDGAATYLAMGRLVVRVDGATGALTPALLHPREPITSLALTRRGLLFYATPTAVGVVAPGGTVEFVKAPAAVLRAAGDSLWLLLPRSLAVVEVEGTEPFRLPARRAAHSR